MGTGKKSAENAVTPGGGQGGRDGDGRESSFTNQRSEKNLEKQDRTNKVALPRGTKRWRARNRRQSEDMKTIPKGEKKD